MKTLVNLLSARAARMIILGLLPILACNAVLAATPAESAFEKMKTLAGQWHAQSEDHSGTITYTVHSAGSALVEEFAGMVTVYHLDGDSILMTHYCAAGNQPRMRASHFTPGNASLDFDFVDISNLKPGMFYMKGLKIEWLGDGRVREIWTGHEPDGTETTENFILERTR